MSVLDTARAAYARILASRSVQPAGPSGQPRDHPSPPAGLSGHHPGDERDERNERTGGRDGLDRDGAGVRSSPSFLSSPGYELITAPDGVRRAADAVARHAAAVGLDTETTGLDPRTARVRLVQVAVGGQVFLVDVFALPDPTATLAGLFEALAGVEVVAHNAAFDLRFLARLGFTPGRVFDTLVASKLAAGLAPSGGRDRHDLGSVVKRHLNRDLDKREQRSDWAGPLVESQIRYAAADAAVLVPLAAALRACPELDRQARTVALEMRAVPAVAWLRPVSVDVAAWAAIADRAGADRDRLAAALEELAPDPARLPGLAARNWNSPAQVAAAFAAMGAPLDATDDAALAAVSGPAPAAELARLLRAYRAAVKKAGSYGRPWLAQHVVDGTVWPAWHQLGAGTGRMSCSAPNLQQVPRDAEYRRCLVARPGHVLVKADYSQIELRIAAKVAGDPGMIEAYRAGADLHTRTAAAVLGKPEAAVTKGDRQLAKAVNFGLLYGMGANGLVGYARANYGVALTPAEAAAYKAKFFAAYPGLRRWHDRTRAELARRPVTAAYRSTTLGGRGRSIPDHKQRTGATAGDYYPNLTEALNSPIQGTGADGLKAALALLWEQRVECPGAVPVLVCHDEIVVEAPASVAGRAAEWLERCMTDGMAPLIAPVPVVVELASGLSWAG